MKRGTPRRNIIQTSWSRDLAYVLGLLATDGNIYSDKRHVNFTSKDKDLVLLFKKLLKLSNKVGTKSRGGEKERTYYVLQFGSVRFCRFLLSVGITPAKSKTIESVKVPDRYFWDFLRGCLDGDGNINEFKHPESIRMQLRVRFASASPVFLMWQLSTIRRLGSINGGWIHELKNKSASMLCFGKKDSIAILRYMYYTEKLPCLKRKYSVAERYVGRVA